MKKSNYGNVQKDIAVSVIIPSFNDKKHVTKAINSVLNSSTKEVEVIVVDDGSSDNTSELLQKKYGKNIHLVIHKKNQGLGASRNTGMKLAAGKFIMFLDSDDWLDENCIDDIYSIATKEKADIIAFGVRKTWKNGKTEPYHAHSFSTKGGLEALRNFTEYKIGSIATNKLFNKNFLIKIGIKFTPRYYHEDVMFTLNAIYRCKKYISTETVYYNYLQRNASIINKKPTVLHVQSFIALIRELEKFILDTKLHLTNEDIADDIIYSHWISELIPKSIKYYSATTKDIFKKISQTAFSNEHIKRFIPSTVYYNLIKFLSNYVSIIKESHTKQLTELERKLNSLEQDNKKLVYELASIKNSRLWKYTSKFSNILTKFK